MTTDQLNIWLAVTAVVLTAVSVAVAIKTFDYMQGRDEEIDIRTGWIAIHKAMVNLRLQREFVMADIKMCQDYGTIDSSDSHRLERDYHLAHAQLRAQLDRLNEEPDPLIVQIRDFLDANQFTKQWQNPKYTTPFEEFAKQAALKARPL